MLVPVVLYARAVLPVKLDAVSLFILMSKLLRQLRQGQVTAAGRAKLRERVAVEHTLAHISQWLFSIVPVTSAHGKDIFDLWRMTLPQLVVENVDKTTYTSSVTCRIKQVVNKLKHPEE